LAYNVAEHANSQENEAICKRWRDVNALRKPDRAPVWCRPVACWSELLPEDALACSDPFLREVEYYFRQIIIKKEINDDSPLKKYFPVKAEFDVEPSNRWGVDIGKHRSTEEGGSWRYDPPLKTESDFAKLRQPVFTYNHQKTTERLEYMDGLIGDVLPVKLACGPAYEGVATLGTAAADLRGLEQMMMDMIAEPKLMHTLMKYLLEVKLKELDAWESTGLLTVNIDEPMFCSDPIGDLPMDGKFDLKNLWCDGNSQEFDQVSPAMWEEFCLNYQRPIFERFGRVCYGCCENLTHKIDGVLSIPNLRILVCSAWTDLDVVLNKVGKDYSIMWRQKASEVVFPDDVSTIRNDLVEGLQRLQGHYYQIVLRELQTLVGHPDRLHIWTDIAKELSAKYS